MVSTCMQPWGVAGGLAPERLRRRIHRFESFASSLLRGDEVDVAAAVEGSAASSHVEHVRACVLQERPVMRDSEGAHDDAMAHRRLQRPFEPEKPVDIEVVRGLVQQEEPRTAREGDGQSEP